MSTVIRLKPDEIDFVIYHDPCPDGFGSAYAVWKFMALNYPDRQVTYFPASFDKKAPDVTGKNVLICDFSYKKDILLNMIKQANSLLVIDHHLSAQKELADIPDVNKIFDMKKSGAGLTWAYCFPSQKIPLLIQYIEDRDIWTKILENTDAFASWFYNLPFEFAVYDKYTDDDLLLEMIKTKGLSFIELNEYNTNQATDYVAPKFMKIYDQKTGDRYYIVGYVNSTILKSDIGNRIFTTHPHIDFSAVYSISDKTNSTSFSLRSTERHVDVSDVAVLLSGGGHRNASGVRVNYVTNVLPGLVYDNGSLYDKLKEIYFGNILDLNAVYINFPTNKLEVGNYLLQTKCFDKNTKEPVQECVFVGNQYKHKDDVDYKGKIDMACVWSYNGINNVTEFTIVLHPSIESRREELYQCLGADFSNGLIRSGLVNLL